MTDRSILALYAHPDDESLCSGTLARYAAEGVRVTLVCATRGEEGEISDPALATPTTLGEVREGELHCAAEALGIPTPVFLGYRDSGMKGTAANGNTDAFVNSDPDQVVAQLVAIIREMRPQVVITFDESGIYGHPDHVAIWRHAHAAVEAAADAGSYPEAGVTWQVARIAYAVFARSFFTRMREKLIDLGEDTSELDEFIKLGIGFPDDAIHAVLDVADQVDRKFAAIQCHRTQFGGDTFFTRVGEEELRRLMSREYFAFASPGGQRDVVVDDLFG